MAIFNSLGSNYDFGFVLRALIVGNRESYRSQLIEHLRKKYGGEVLLTYKGREALRLALRIADLSKKYTVGICGFTCYAVYEAIILEGYSVRYLDIVERNINFSFEKFVEEIHKHPSLKALIIQNTLGFTYDIEKISKFCKDRNIILVEDLAHSIGAKYWENQEAGTVGDFTVLSFSQDKMIDGISGGALIVRNDKFSIFNFSPQEDYLLRRVAHKGTRFFKPSQFSKIGKKKQLIDRFYPLLTFLIRKTYRIGLGKIMHLILKKFDLLSKPMIGIKKDIIFGLPNWYCHLIYRQFAGLEENLIHRRKIATVYADGLNEGVLSDALITQIINGSNLRFPIFINKREGLIAYLKKHGIYVSDIWYDSPIAPKSYLQLTDYNHECPNSEKTSSIILNLPTHRNINEESAVYIVRLINDWLIGQDKGLKDYKSKIKDQKQN